MKPNPAETPTEVLAGLVERVTFHNEDNGFAVLRVKARGKRDLITVVGHAAVIAAGEFIQASGEWNNDRQHGLQFRARFLKAMPPTTVEGIEKYLGSGMIRGIGPVYAKKLVRAFGVQVFDIIEAEPERLREVTGIGPKRAEGIVAGWAEQRIIREIMIFLHANGVGTSRAVRIYKTYGNDAVQLICEDPYRLARDIRGIGFRTADAVAMKLGIEKTAMIRARAGISYALTEALDDGHCGLPRDELLPLAVKLLEIPESLIVDALTLELDAGAVIADTVENRACVFLAGLYRAEQAIAARLRTLSAGRPPWPAIDACKAIPWVEEKTGLTLAESQKDAVRSALAAKVTVITGGPGVGKTTLVNAILRILAAKRVDLLLCAPTGRAAKRMTETTGREAKTIHRLLEVDPKNGSFKRNEENTLDCELLVIDETSMVDVPLMSALLKAVPSNAAVIFVGDVDQLAAVGPGQALSDMIASGALPVVHLTEVFRQAAESQIIQSAHRINAGRLPELSKPASETDFYFVSADSPEVAVARLIEIVKDRIPRRFGLDPVRDIQVLCPMNRGGVGARSLNIELQKALNPRFEPQVEKFGTTFVVGDKVMQVENDYDKEVYNGDVGFVEAIELETGEMAIDFDGRSVSFQFGELDQVVLAYATTIHKSQGSEYPAVVIPVLTQHYAMLQRNLLYTGVTRGKRLVILLGQKKAIAMAVKNTSGRRRWSKLREWVAQLGNG
ncbi:exodeoxyribonuclease V alpha subunit [Bradyrhizobium sp. GM5.1]|uniref:SF1B family DNA helicase RecD2 n=1 Tax=Bradyrhizobium sp. 156 TaxID=2782630 RepID=UPI001FFA8BCA|nr:ATP-dependent RecD-like DNA helicase [Bradyrhizobium sp. 156]MCK1326486.1 ATP-dependent RecD-like DNA helicase [Bradyrhizobium sp. 156]MCK1326566.1 ATP-dependent RecD-like DNA helicase [Bradyrhizobium sp. 156]